MQAKNEVEKIGSGQWVEKQGEIPALGYLGKLQNMELF